MSALQLAHGSAPSKRLKRANKHSLRRSSTLPHSRLKPAQNGHTLTHTHIYKHTIYSGELVRRLCVAVGDHRRLLSIDLVVFFLGRSFRVGPTRFWLFIRASQPAGRLGSTTHSRGGVRGGGRWANTAPLSL